MHFFLSQEMRGTPRTDDCIETHALFTINSKFLLSLTTANSDSVVRSPFIHVWLSNKTIHSFLVNKTNRRTECQFYWYYNSTCFGQSFCPSSAVLSRTSALVHCMQFDDRLLPGTGWNCSSSLFLKLHKLYQCRCKAKNYGWRAEKLPETCRFCRFYSHPSGTTIT
jgi:hypothetical protein